MKAKLIILNIGIKIGGEMVLTTRFADDIVVTAESEGDTQRAVEEIYEVLTLEMKINSVKTKILVCARDPEIKADVYIDSQKLVQVDEMVYLGSKITSNGKSVRVIKQRIALAKTAFSKKHKLLTSKKLHLNIKMRLIKTYIWSVDTHGCETWLINDTKKKKTRSV